MHHRVNVFIVIVGRTLAHALPLNLALCDVTAGVVAMGSRLLPWAVALMWRRVVSWR
jgi:hypothetical protein